jgi:hypothetical protein
VKYAKGQQVTDAITGTQGTVNAYEGGSTVNVSWEPNSHGGYINDHPRDQVQPADQG